jgi:hypothetical protein
MKNKICWEKLCEENNIDVRKFFKEFFGMDYDNMAPGFTEAETELFCALGKNIWLLDISPRLKSTICRTGVSNLFWFFNDFDPANRYQDFDEEDMQEMEEFLYEVDLDLQSTLDPETIEKYWHFRYYERDMLR